MSNLGIVVTVYNKKQYIKDCINSVLSQSYGDWELIIVDDGSTDGSGELCDEIACWDERIRVLHQENVGPLVSRKHGVERLSSEYITFIDSDDWISSEVYEKANVYMKQKVDCIMYPIVRYIDAENQSLDACIHEQGVYKRDEIERRLIPTMLWNFKRGKWDIDPSLCNKIFKRNMLLKELENAANLDLQYGEDVAVFFPMLYSDILTFSIMEQGRYYHRKNGNDDLPAYILDNSYVLKLCRLYEYMNSRIGNDINMEEQLDGFFSYSANLRLKKYGRIHNNGKRFIFPFQLVEKQSKIIVYGAGKVGQMYMNQIKSTEYAEVVSWVDKNAQKYSKLGVKTIEEIRTVDAIDYIVIAILDKTVAENATRELLKIGIPKEKIIWHVKEI